jgi:hypothetical protein
VNSLRGEDGQLEDPGERIDSYLDELLLALRGRPREARRLLTEVEGHLRESIEALIAAGFGEPEATEETLRRFGPPSAVARGLPPRAAYRTLLGQLTEAALLVISVLCLAAGAAAFPAAVLGLVAYPSLVTGDQPGQAVTPGRCQQLLHMLAAPSCPQALAAHHLQEVIRNHLLTGWLGFLVLVGWWVLHVHRKARPAVLPAGFALTVCGTFLGAIAALLLAIGISDVARGVDAIGDLIGSGDLVATGATMMAAALLCWMGLALQATRPASMLAAVP